MCQTASVGLSASQGEVSAAPSPSPPKPTSRQGRQWESGVLSCTACSDRSSPYATPMGAAPELPVQGWGAHQCPRWSGLSQMLSGTRGLGGERLVPGVHMLSRFSCARLFAIPWIIAHQAPLSMGIL